MDRGHSRLTRIDGLHPDGGIRADGESIAILSAKDGHLQDMHAQTFRGAVKKKKRTFLSSPSPGEMTLACWQKSPPPSCRMIKGIFDSASSY